MIKWILVYITLQGSQPLAVAVTESLSMTECFHAREALVLSINEKFPLQAPLGHFPPGQQAVCIPTPNPDDIDTK